MSAKNPFVLVFVVLFKILKCVFLGIAWIIIVLGVLVKNK